jgi:subtilisin family serine protease
MLCWMSLVPHQVMGQSPDLIGRIRRHPEAIRNQYIVVLNDGIDRKQVSAIANNLARVHGGTLLYTYENSIRGFSAQMSEASASALSRNPLVDYVEEDVEVFATATQTNSQWGLDRMDQTNLPLDSAYNYSNTGAGVNVYIIDSGIRATHQEFGGRASNAYDAVADGQNGNDCYGHGTHVAGIIGGSTYGVAKGVNLRSVRVLDCLGRGPISRVIAGVEWVTTGHIKPAVANLSFISTTASDSLDNAVRASINAGVTYVVSAGNNNIDAGTRSPSRVAEAITVAATDTTDSRAAFSNFGSVVDVFAPGVDITSAWVTDDTSTNIKSGTSSAAPFVAGAVARILQSNPSFSPADISRMITISATSGKVTNAGIDSPNLMIYACSCASSMAPSHATANTELQNSYNLWKVTYVTSSGAGNNLRVRNDSGKTTSEAMSFGMLLAAYLGDRLTFDGLWNYAKSHLNVHGVMSWEIDSNNIATAAGAATDADEDMALALIAADKRWGGYGTDARTLVGNIMTHEVEPNTFVLKPGDDWGGSDETNPSYYAPAYYRVFKAYTGDANWDRVIDKSFEIIANLNAKTGAGTTGLQPEWCTASGDPVPRRTAYYFDYRYTACRVPWRRANDAVWYCDASARSQLDKLNTFFKGVGAANIKDGYKLDGTLAGQWHNAAFVAPAASGAMTSPDSAYKTSMWDETIKLVDEGYYHDTLRLLSLLLMTGNMPNPLNIVGGGSGVDDSKLVLDNFESGSTSRWGAYNDANTSITSSIVAPGAAGDYGMQVQYSIGSWGGVDQGYEIAQNWSNYQTFDFWFNGTNTGTTIRLEIYDNKMPASTTGDTERFEHKFVDNFTGWKHFSIPWAAFARRSEWQPAGAPNDGFTLTEIWGFNFAPLRGAGSFQMDQVELVKKTYSVFDNFESGNTSKWETFTDGSSTISPAIASPGKVGNYAMTVQYNVISYGGVAQWFSTPQDWSSYSAFEFWFYGTDSNTSSRTTSPDGSSSAYRGQASPGALAFNRPERPMMGSR